MMRVGFSSSKNRPDYYGLRLATISVATIDGIGKLAGAPLLTRRGYSVGMTQRSLHIAAYDISSAARLRSALRVLRNYATGGQKSVFECFLTPTEKGALLAEMREVIDDTEDRFLLIRLDPRMEVLTLGIAVAPIDPEFYYVG